MSDDRVRTFVDTERGRLPFQTYLVRDRGRGRVRRIELAGAARARPAPGVLDALATQPRDRDRPVEPAGLDRSHPRDARRSGGAVRAPARPAAAICPLVGGRPISGPLHRMLRGLGHEVSPRGVARLYVGLIDLFVLDGRGRALAPRHRTPSACASSSPTP